MKLMDEKGRLFGKVNLFDLLVLLAILAVVAGVGYKLLSNRQQEQAAQNTTDWIVTIKASGMEPGFAEALRKDDKIYYDTDGYVNATISDVREEPAMVNVPTAIGTLVLAEDPRLKDVYVDVLVQDASGDIGVKIGRYTVATGNKIAIKTIYAFYDQGIVIDMRKQ